jgi:MoaA/NifB/PqqE/SkfB family radical SAM enzyme
MVNTHPAFAEASNRAVPPLQTLYFYLTEGCNLRCRHCWIEPPHQSAKRQYPSLDPKLFGTSWNRPSRWA